MAYLDNNNFVLNVGAASPAATQVNGLSQFNDDADTQTTTERLLGADPLTSTAKNPRGFDGAGVVDSADAGQGVIEDAYESQATIFIQVLEDGTNGYEYPVKVTSYGRQRTADQSKIRYSFTMEQDGTRTVVGTP